MAQHKHLKYEERVVIGTLLTQDKSLSFIAVSLDRDISTIRLEIVKHRIPSKKASYGRTYNNCELFKNCDYKGLCENCVRDNCRKCSDCNDLCSHYQPSQCSRRDSKPYCCNGCPEFATCCFLKYIYNPTVAQKQYEETLVSSRQGLNISSEEVAQLGALVDKYIKDQGQSINAVLINNADEFNICSKTLYNYINEGIFNTRNIDLARKVRFAPRKGKIHHKVDKKCRENRSFEDFLKFLDENPNIDVVEIDSVESIKGAPVLLTIFFRSCSLQLAFKRISNNARSVKEIFDDIYLTIGHDNFTTLFPVILADNGTEFSDPESIEYYKYIDEVTGEVVSIKRTSVFYCDPGAPYQKGACERNHEFIRYFIPKGKSFEPYCQDDINLMMNHINSYVRDNKKKNLLSPTSRFIALYGEKLAALLSISLIDSKQVTLNSSIFKR